MLIDNQSNVWLVMISRVNIGVDDRYGQQEIYVEESVGELDSLIVGLRELCNGGIVLGIKV